MTTNPHIDPWADALAARYPGYVAPRGAPIDRDPRRDTPCACGYDLCGECMRGSSPRRHMIVPGAIRVRLPDTRLS